MTMNFKTHSRLLFTVLSVGIAAGALPWLSVAQEIEEVQITASYIPDEKLETAEVAELLDASDMSLTGDSNIGDALKRLPGLSLVGGKFVYVRGLGERYSSTYFNGTLMPGIEPLTRAVPLDLFDTSVTSNVLVQKTYSVNYGGEFSGGVVDIRSVALPDDRIFKLKIGAGHNDYSTGEDGFNYEGGGRDWLGYDNGARELPSLVASYIDREANPSLLFNTLSDQEYQSTIQAFSNEWVPHTTKNDRDFSFSGALGNRWEITDRISLGALFTTSYGSQVRNRLIERTRWANTQVSNTDPDFIASAEQLRDDTVNPSILADNNISRVENYARTQTEINFTNLFTVGAEIDGLHQIKYTGMLLRKTEDEASVRDMVRANFNNVLQRFYRLEWIENEIEMHQISVDFPFDSIQVRGRYALVDGNREAPDARESWHAIDRDFPSPNNTFALTNDGASGDYSRDFSTLNDEGEDLGVDFEVPLARSFPYVSEMTFKFGFSRYEKDRSFEFDRFRLNVNTAISGVSGGLTNSGINADLPLEVLFDTSNCFLRDPMADPLDPLTAPLDTTPPPACFYRFTRSGSHPITFASEPGISAAFGFSAASTPTQYQGSTKITGNYAAFDMTVLDNLRVNLGIRRESSKQTVENVNQDGSVDSGSSVDLSSQYTLPAVSITWDFWDNMQLRGAYSESLNRPILRELSEVSIFNPQDGRRYQGNSELQIAEVENFDLRFEWYFGDADYLSATAFLKKIRNPIELNEDESGDGILVQSWSNTESAENEGYEFEVRKYFGEYWFATVNATHINSRTEGAFGSDLGVLNDPNRPLVGLSKELLNAQITYESEKGSMSLAWNKFSRRIATIGRETGEVYELPRESLNFNGKWNIEFSGSTVVLGFKATNLLDERAEYVTRNGLPYDNWDIGQTYSVSLEYKAL